jgi:hypothetical protein
LPFISLYQLYVFDFQSPVVCLVFSLLGKDKIAKIKCLNRREDASTMTTHASSSCFNISHYLKIIIDL